ncbi:hypothetical protein B9N43_15690 [Denitratisoma sp. DHT3]|nr:hypothetical protein B9N43_15690 [Denitratisoma sp. DHT3]
MLKWLGLILVIWLVYAVWRRSTPRAPRGERETPRSEAMVACSHCRLYVPRTEACFSGEGQPYCCPQHRRLGPKQ